jgi:uncharacterized protein YjcR
MRSLSEREEALNMYFHKGCGYKEICKALNIPLDTVKSWCRRYRIQNNIPKRGKIPLSKEPISKESINPKNKVAVTPEDRIARLEMNVELLRNFLILTEEE